MTKILVGPDKVQFLVHKELLIEYSPFFAAKSKACWTDAGSGIDLSHVSVDGFESAVGWLYAGRPLKVPTKSQFEDMSEWGQYLTMFNHAYKAADQLMMTELQNKILDDLRGAKARFRVKTTYADLINACEADLEHTLFYKFILRDLTWLFMNDTFHNGRLSHFNHGLEYLEAYPGAMADWFANIAMWRNDPWSDPKNSRGCGFHVHNGENKCHTSNADV